MRIRASSEIPASTVIVASRPVARIALVEVMHPVQAGEVQHGAARVLRRVAVRASEPAGDHAAAGRATGGERGSHLAGRRGTADLGPGGGGHPPAREQLLGHFR